MDQPNPKKKQPKIVTEVDDFGRKKFILQENESSEGQQDEQKEKRLIDTGRYSSTLVGRQQKIDTDKYIGKIEGTKKKKKTEVFYCDVCEVGFKCDLAYITHINSPSHNRKLGMNMKVEAVSVGTVADKLARMAEENQKSKQEKIMEKKLGKNWKSDLLGKSDPQLANLTKSVDKKATEDRTQVRNGGKQVEPKQNQVKAEPKPGEKNEQEVEEQQEQEDEDEKMMRSLGLPTSFGSKKKKY